MGLTQYSLRFGHGSFFGYDFVVLTTKNSQTSRPLLSHQNHFEFGYERDGVFHPFSARKNSTDSWTVRYGRSRRMPMGFRSECGETARTIRRDTNDPIVVLFSGGADSEVALRAFAESGIAVSVAILRFAEDLNIHDYAWAVMICETLRVPYRFYDLDLRKFWKTEAIEYAKATQCVSPQLLSTMWLVDQVEGYPVLGSGEHYIAKRPPANPSQASEAYPRTHWDLIEKEKIAAWYRHFLVRGRSGCPGFFQYTPELMLSWLVDPMGLDLWNDRIPGKLDSMSTKLRFYKQHFDIKDRPKYSGFEKLTSEDLLFRTTLYDLFSDADWAYATPVPYLVRSLSPKPESYPPSEVLSQAPISLGEPELPTPYRYKMSRPV